MNMNINHSWRKKLGDENPFLSDRLVEGLRYSDEDVESSCRFVLLCPYEILEDGTMYKYVEFNDPRKHRFSILNSPRSYGVHRIHNYRGLQRLSWG